MLTRSSTRMGPRSGLKCGRQRSRSHTAARLGFLSCKSPPFPSSRPQRFRRGRTSLSTWDLAAKSSCDDDAPSEPKGCRRRPDKEKTEEEEEEEEDAEEDERRRVVVVVDRSRRASARPLVEARRRTMLFLDMEEVLCGALLLLLLALSGVARVFF